MENIITGIQLATTPEALIAILIGLIAGQILGAIPGLTASMAVALLVPYTFYLDPWIGIPMLLGMFKGSLFGSSITAILIKTPGTPSSTVAAAAGVPGVLIKEYHQEVGKIMTDELIQLGLLDLTMVKNQDPEKPAYRKYFMHGTSHHLGLDTHDYGLVDQPLKANMVLTVEPGIYIPEEGFGIRLEDDVVIQSKGYPINLMKDIPIEPDHIEDLMN